MACKAVLHQRKAEHTRFFQFATSVPSPFPWHIFTVALLCSTSSAMHTTQPTWSENMFRENSNLPIGYLIPSTKVPASMIAMVLTAGGILAQEHLHLAFPSHDLPNWMQPTSHVCCCHAKNLTSRLLMTSLSGKAAEKEIYQILSGLEGSVRHRTVVPKRFRLAAALTSWTT